jgi:4-hydroxy 2-oxovalerate aldolase
MSYNVSSDFKILDCTIRDGGYINNWNFDKKFVREVYRALSKSGVDFVEVGFRGTEKFFNKDEYGLWRFSSEGDIREIIKGIKGPKIAIMADFGKIESSDFCEKEDSVVDLIRVAAHKNKTEDAVKLLEEIKGKGYEVSLQAMGYSNYTVSERKDFINLLKKSSIDYAYVADSYGSIFPNQINDLISPLLELHDIKIGFHPHNSLQMAFANTLEAINCGVHIVDSSIFGMGRGAGNLPTEIILSFMGQQMPDKFNVIPVLNIVDRYFIDMQKELNWGYQLPFMLSGLFQCHPYYAKNLVGRREYTMEDIWKVLDVINKKSPVGFSEDLLNQIIEKGIIGGLKPDGMALNNRTSNFLHTKIDYINRHKEKTFLILGNGPTLREYRTQIQEFIDKYQPIVMGANYLGSLFKPHYHAFYNKRRFINYIDTVDKDSIILIGQHIPDEMIIDYTPRSYEKIYYVDALSDFDITDGVIQSNCRTISVLLLGVAIVMGAEKIFAAGLDGYVSADVNGEILFYDEKERKLDRDIIIDMQRWNKKYVGQINDYFVSMGKEGIHILTPTSYGEFYKGIKNYI